MGEITEALRRAWQERNRQSERGPADWPGPTALDHSAPPLGPQAEAEALGEEAEVHIPDSKESGWAGRAVLADQRGRFAECFRHFALRVRRELEKRGTRAVLITSAVRQDGKTTAACNLTLAFASMAAGRQNALVELDLRRPGIAQALGVAPPRVGFERVLRGEAPLHAARLHGDAGLDLFLVRETVAHAHEILAGPELGAALRELTRRYDTVVLDTPPVLAVPDVALIVPHLEACVTVARAGATPRSAFRAMLEVLPEEKVIGAFLNNARAPRHYGRYAYYYGYREDSEAR